MAYDEALAARVRAVLAGVPAVTEQRMFGGLAFLDAGRMAVAVSGSQGGLMVRVEPEQTAAVLAEAHTSPLEMNGRETRGWVLVGPEGCAHDDDLAAWVRTGLARARTLPPKG